MTPPEWRAGARRWRLRVRPKFPRPRSEWQSRQGRAIHPGGCASTVELRLPREAHCSAELRFHAGNADKACRGLCALLLLCLLKPWPGPWPCERRRALVRAPESALGGRWGPCTKRIQAQSHTRALSCKSNRQRTQFIRVGGKGRGAAPRGRRGGQCAPAAPAAEAAPARLDPKREQSSLRERGGGATGRQASSATRASGEGAGAYCAPPGVKEPCMPPESPLDAAVASAAEPKPWASGRCCRAAMTAMRDAP